MTIKTQDKLDTAPLSAHRRRTTFWVIGGTAALGCILVGSGAWLSPTWTPAQVVKAAKSGDRTKLEKLVDFRSVRSSLETDLKETMGAAFRKEIASSGDPFVMMFSELGAGFLDAAATSIAEQVVTPNALEKAANGEAVEFDLMGDTRNVLPDLRPANDGRPNFTAKGRYLTFSRYEYHLRPKSSETNVYVQMRRTGLFSWQVDRVKLDPNWMKSAASAEPEPSSVEAHYDAAETQSAPASSGTAEVKDEEIWALYEHHDCGDLVGPERTGCWEAEQEIQDRRLNAEYAALRSRLDGPDKERLRQLQLAWIKAKDTKCSDPEFGYGAWATAACLTEETAERRLFLRNYQP